MSVVQASGRLSCLNAPHGRQPGATDALPPFHPSQTIAPPPLLARVVHVLQAGGKGSAVTKWRCTGASCCRWSKHRCLHMHMRGALACTLRTHLQGSFARHVDHQQHLKNAWCNGSVVSAAASVAGRPRRSAASTQGRRPGVSQGAASCSSQLLLPARQRPGGAPTLPL